jgi:hypothetical protein
MLKKTAILKRLSMPIPINFRLMPSREEATVTINASRPVKNNAATIHGTMQKLNM